MSRADYVAQMAPYAATASAATSIPTGVILSQWAVETGNGTSDLVRRANNHAGITYSSNTIGHKDNGTAYAAYDSIDQFVQDYIRVMNLSYYTGVHGQDVIGAIRALGASPWAESHYAYTAADAPSVDVIGKPGQILNDVYYAAGLAKYDSGVHQAASGIDANTAKLAAIGAAALALFALMSSNNH